MVCPRCGQLNDPSSVACARCNLTLQQAPAPPPQVAYSGYPPPADTHPPAVIYQPSRRSRLPLIAGLAVLILIALVTALVVLRKQPDKADTPAAAIQPSTAPPPTEVETEKPAEDKDPRVQAAAIDHLLSQSVASRAKLNIAIKRVGNCTDLTSAVADLRAVGTERQAQLDAVTSADLSALPTGESLRNGLGKALRFALKADQGFLAWAEPTIRNGCGTTTARANAYRMGQDASTQAGAAKKAFLTGWNPVAAQNGLATRSADQI